MAMAMTNLLIEYDEWTQEKFPLEGRNESQILAAQPSY